MYIFTLLMLIPLLTVLKLFSTSTRKRMAIRPVLEATNKSCTLQLATNEPPILFLIRFKVSPIIRSSGHGPLGRRNGRGSDCTLRGGTPRPSSFQISQESAPKPCQTSPCNPHLSKWFEFWSISICFFAFFNTVIPYLLKREPPPSLHQLPCFHQRHGAEVLQFSSCLCLSRAEFRPSMARIPVNGVAEHSRGCACLLRYKYMYIYIYYKYTRDFFACC